MDKLLKKIEYLKGYMDALEIDTKSNEGKALVKIVDVLDCMVDVFAEIDINQQVTDEIIDDLESLLLDSDDEDFDDDDNFIFLDDDDDDYDDEDEVDYFEIQCPSCKEDVMVDFDMIDDANGIVCPNCNEEIELEFEPCECDDEDCED